ncbi:MAG TPA: MerR family transcriptional regulator [Spirochaetota bacterium]|nr:MerR family transcriptional regulator [Spirochaetota bacterium]HPF06622.1 MerR family transcriptional regulator [Spirochaetota bacterium]HPJ43123.1 MerR family transcriptional regulator [Spirochaetota bacterium]HPR37843.1 MerR family transcriptional regulator [Spirochaetota bacterium]HRX47517.1 MerR family transcriptional regulator [Spirochaetota bacterium]
MSIEKYTISELAGEFDISPSTIRFYEEKGLLVPERSQGNQRVYSQKHRGRLKLILRGKRFGATLDEIAEMIGMADAEVSEIEQIDKSLYYINKKYEEIQIHKNEIKLFEKDLLALKEKLLHRKGELSE